MQLQHYMMTSWLHLQWHLPCAACNAVLGILACLLFTLSPTLVSPFVTLPSVMKVLGLDSLPIYELACCPSCHEVYPPAGSLHTVDECITCKVPLFLSDKTKRSFLCSKKTPSLKYPYMPLSHQLQSILSIPGIKDSLDEWHTKPQSPGVYTDIFDGDMCRNKLKAPDGTLFFANGPQDQCGPNGELHISVTLGIDWYTFGYMSAIHHVWLALTGFHIYVVTSPFPIHCVQHRFPCAICCQNTGKHCILNMTYL